MKETVEYQYIIGEKNQEKSEDKKTDVYDIKNKKSGMTLGRIKWNSSWRQYCFFPRKDTVYSKGCMEDINDLISRMEDDRQ